MSIQEDLSIYGKPIQEVARFTCSQGYGIGVRSFALFLLFPEDWQRTFTYPGAPDSMTGSVAISRREHDLLASTAARAASMREMKPFLRGAHPANVSLKTNNNRGAYILAIKDGRVLVICTPQVQRQPENMLYRVSDIMSRVTPETQRLTLLSSSPTGDLTLTTEHVRCAPDKKLAQ